MTIQNRIKVFILTGVFMNIFQSNLISQELVWGQVYQGNGIDRANGITTDASDNLYVTGTFASAIDFDPGPNEFLLSNEGFGNAFVQKLDEDGNLVWASNLGGDGGDEGLDISVDASGNVYSTGYFANTADFDPGPDVYNITCGGFTDIYISKLNSDGEFVWAKSITNFLEATGYSIALDAASNVVITGSFAGTADFDPGVNEFNMTSAGDRDIFVLKLNSDGEFMWAISVPAVAYDEGLAIDTDSEGNVYTTGFFTETADFDPGEGVFNLTAAGNVNNDIYVQKLDGAGNFVWAQSFGSTSYDRGYGLAVDNNDNVWITGQFALTTDFDSSAGEQNHTSAGGADIFILKLSSDGDFFWAGSEGNMYDDYGLGITTDALGNVYSTGYFFLPVDFNPGEGEFVLPGEGKYVQIFIQKLSNDGAFISARALNGTWQASGNSIAADSGSNSYTVGQFLDTIDLDPGSVELNFESPNWSDYFILKLDNSIAENVSERLNEQTVMIYPNPCEKYLQLQSVPTFHPTSIAISNLMGELLYQQKLTGIALNSIELSLASGVYFIQLESEEGKTEIVKLIVRSR